MPVRLPGLGRVRASIGRDGDFRVNTSADRAVVEALNAPGTYKGKTRNRANIGLDNAGFKALCDADPPDEPLELAS